MSKIVTKSPPFSETSNPSYLKNTNLLSDYSFLQDSFPDKDAIFQSFKEESFIKLSIRKRFKKINQTLYQLIKKAPKQSFLLSAVLDYLEKVNQEQLLNEVLTFAGFEFWLNNFSELSEQENYEVRAKIAGKWVPRNAYQAFFPIGMDRYFTGTHFIAAHHSPDVDTMIGSFWGWLDAFAAKVGTGLHIWSLPGGPPESPVTAILAETFGKGLFPHLARTGQTLTLTALDLVTHKKLTKELGSTLTGAIDHGLNEKAVILINEQGHYLGDWRSSDVELVRQITILFKSCLRWFENNLHTRLISLFAKVDLSVVDLSAFYSSIFDVKIIDCEPALDFNERQKRDLNDFFYKILQINDGLYGSFRDLNQALSLLQISEMLLFQKEVEALSNSSIFDDNGKLLEDRPKIFNHLEKLINKLDEAILQVRNYVERLDTVLDIKYKVLGFPLLYITLRSDVDEMRYKMQNYDFLTVVIDEQDGSLFPVGVVSSSDLRKVSLGTVSLRDFCNTEEIKMASYLEIVSVIDHHKSSLKTTSVPLAIIGDAQSCNVLIAEKTFLVNDPYSLRGLNEDSIEKQIKSIFEAKQTPSTGRILQRLLQRRAALEYSKEFFVHPKREYTEYLFFLHAILDDTDLLTKVSNRDVECVAELLNRMKSITLGCEVEIVNFDNIPKDKNFARLVAQRILQQPDMYSIYKKIYDFREKEVETNLELCIGRKNSHIFLDTKEQNSCARVGQTKMFASNFDFFLKHADTIRSIWLDKAKDVARDSPEIDFHLHMISTIASAQEVYRNQIGPYAHQDELWFWVPPTQQAFDHLATFLSGFQYVAKEINDEMSIEFLGSYAEDYLRIFTQNFFSLAKISLSKEKKDLPIAILRFKAGTLNSRKSMITPFIPRFIH